MIDQMPEHRALPDDVRMRARQRISEGMRPAARNGRPALIAAGVSMLAAGAVVAGQVLLGGSADPAAPPMQHNGEFVGTDRKIVYEVRRGEVDPDVLARCAAAAKDHPPAGEWQTIATSRNAGTVLTAFRVPAGVFFCATTAVTTTISAPDPARLQPGDRQAKILFTTTSGAMAGLVSPDVAILNLARVGDQGLNNALPAVVDGLFLEPNGYTKAETGTTAMSAGREWLVSGVPRPTPPVVDRPQPPAPRDTPQEQRFAQCLRDRPIPDPDQFALGVAAKVGPNETIMAGRFGDLLLLCNDTGGPVPGRVHESADLQEVRGSTIAALGASYDFKTHLSLEGVEYNGSTSLAAVGLVLDPRVASITYTRPGVADVPASLGGGTFVLAAPLIDQHPDARVVVRDAAGNVLESITPQHGR
ncbi:hypothetical protein [Lentzea sp. HUAS12]|uniref:hypothetical protein n=1 Tax=Lentzea sp. HUAS12 TaxID=2951806 RepID=UPI0020A0897E|nr:hypothetical protein [Lentzea sp. HUAS12]USX54198.1 hypothetical protein ND450_08890 [Lentzea sp. HUAS12]